MKKSLTAVSVIGLVLQANDSLASELDGKDRDGAALTGTADEQLDTNVDLAGLVAGVAEYDQYVFTTSSSGAGEIGQWAAASGSGLFGTEAADFICQLGASGAGLPNPASYVAWMSDAQDDAYCRAHGLTGQVASDCGASGGLPDSAGPWLRTDGQLFGGSLSEIVTSGEIYRPVALGASGGLVGSPSAVWTGTKADGTASEFNCSNWTSASSGSGLIGDSLSSTDFWTDQGAAACFTPARLNCLSTGASGAAIAPPIPPYTASERRVFISSISGSADLSSWALPDGGTPADDGLQGLAAGDAICRSLASAGGLASPDVFKALLVETNGAIEDRFDFRNDWYRVDHIQVIESLQDLFTPDLNIQAPIILDEFGSPVNDIPLAWTGMSDRGTSLEQNCNDWSLGASGQVGAFGAASFADQRMIFSAFQSCSAEARLYCLSDSDQISTGRFSREDFYD